MKHSRVLSCLLLLTFSTQVHAAVPDTTAQFPILQCPASNEVMKDFRNKLADLKKSIKAEANCAPVVADVEKLGNLVTTQRPDFLKLIVQGRSQGLTAENRQSVETYVSDLTTTTSNILDVLTGNDACFAEDRQGSSLSFVTSLIGEGAKIIALVSGPAGSTVSVVANVITGFLKGMEQIQKNHKGYNFKLFDQRVAYTDTLCAFFDYRRELDNLLNPYDSVSNLENLKVVVDKQLDVLYKSCAECALMIDQVQAEIDAGRNTVETLWTAEFEKQMILLAESIDTTYVRKLGSNTYRSLKTRSWLPERISALESNRLKADLGLLDVLNQMKDIEYFLVDKQVDWFLDYQVNEARRWKSEVIAKVTEGRELLYKLKQPMIQLPGSLNFPETYYEYYGWNSEMEGYVATDDYYKYSGAVLESLELAKDKLTFTDKAKVNSFFRQYDDKTLGLKVSVDVVDNYCTFFALADWYGTNGVIRHCEDPQFIKMKSDTTGFTSISPNLLAEISSPLPAEIPVTGASAAEDLTTAEQEKILPGRDAGEEAVQATTADATTDDIALDWVASMTSSLKKMTSDPNYVLRLAK